MLTYYYLDAIFDYNTNYIDVLTKKLVGGIYEYFVQ